MIRRLSLIVVIVMFSAIRPALSGQEKAACPWLEKPVDNATFKTFLDFFGYDRHLPFRIQSIEVKEYEGIRKEHLSFQSTPGEQVFANLYSPAGLDAKKTPALIVLHGGTPQGKDAYNQLWEIYSRAGWIVLAIDMKYFGERRTDLLTTYTEKDKHDELYNKPSLYLEWVIQTTKDVRRSFDILTDQIGVNPQRIGFVGFSRGAIIGPIIGAIEQRLAAIVLLYGAHFDALETGHLPAACPANYIGRLSPRPLLMINGTRDTDHIKDTSVEPLYKLGRAPKRIIWIEGGHGSLTDEARSQMLQWLQENIK